MYFFEDVFNKADVDTKLVEFFKVLFSNIILNSIHALMPESAPNTRDIYSDGDLLASKFDCSMQSFSYIYHQLRRFFSDYRIAIYKEMREWTDSVSDISLGSFVLGSSYEKLCGVNIEPKLFVVVRIYTDYPLSEKEQTDVKDRVDIFLLEINDFISQLNIIVENYITDESLYSFLPFSLNENSIILDKLITILYRVKEQIR